MGSRAYDVVIIGGGIVGISAAYWLAQRRAGTIALLERDLMLGAGSTGRSAGGIRAQFSSPINIAIQKEAVRFYASFKDEIGGDPEFHQYGYLFLAASEQQMENFRRNVALQRAHGIDVHEVDTGEIARIAPYVNLEGIVGGTFSPTDGYADPHGAIQGLAECCKRMGVEVLFQSEVTALRRSGDRVTAAVTASGEIEGGTFINAAGAWCGPVGRMAGAELPVQPVRRMLFVTKPMTPADSGIRADMPMTVDMGSGVYFRRESGGILFGLANAREAPGYDTTIDWNFFEVMIEAAMKRVPAMEQAEVLRGWAGLYDTSPDEHAVLGRIPGFSNFWIISGFSGHGFMQGPIAARLVAEQIVDGRSSIDIRPLRPERFAEGEPLHEANII
jgi:sarcosine oxidase subunit beta